MEELAKKEAKRIFDVHYSIMNSALKFSHDKAKKHAIATCENVIECAEAVSGSYPVMVQVRDFWKLVIEEIKLIKHNNPKPKRR